MEDHSGVTRHIGVPWTSKEVPVDRLLQWAICGVRGLTGAPNDINTGNNNNNNNNINNLNKVSGLVGGPEFSTTNFGSGSSSSNNNCNNDYNSVSYLNHFYQGSLKATAI